jgi:hypothetical protein
MFQSFFIFIFCRDTSKANAVELKSLGAVVSDIFTDEMTHMIFANGSEKRLKSAAIFEIIVVSPLWIEHCKLSGR